VKKRQKSSPEQRFINCKLNQTPATFLSYIPKRFMKITILAGSLLLLPVLMQAQSRFKYLPLGDSYTICEGLPVTDRWPMCW
jgi:hypothetical protein